MTADVINLRRARKAKARSGKDRTAAASRAAFGRTKAEKTQSAAERERHLRSLEAHRRTNKGEDEPA
jgi:hypothetical protein